MLKNTNIEKLADAKSVAGKLADLPKEALLYIAGYAEGCRDKQAEAKPEN